VSLAVNLCINCSFFTFIWINGVYSVCKFICTYFVCNWQVFWRLKLSDKTSYLNWATDTSFLPDDVRQSIARVCRWTKTSYIHLVLYRTNIERVKGIDTEFYLAANIARATKNFWEITHSLTSRPSSMIDGWRQLAALLGDSVVASCSFPHRRIEPISWLPVLASIKILGYPWP